MVTNKDRLLSEAHHLINSLALRPNQMDAYDLEHYGYGSVCNECDYWIAPDEDHTLDSCQINIVNRVMNT